MTTSGDFRSDSLVITVTTAFAANTTADITVNRIDHYIPGMIQKAFPCSSLEVGEDADIQESDLITALGADTPDEIGQFWSTFNFTTRVLIEDIFHFLRGLFNTSAVTSTALPTTLALTQQSGNPPTTPITTFDQAIAQDGALTTPLTLPAANWTGQLRLVLGGSPTFAADAQMVIRGFRR